MSNHVQDMQELEREVMRLMKEAAKHPNGKSVLFADALKKIQAAKKSGTMQDILKAYDIVLDLGYQPRMRKADDIAIVIDALAFYSGRFVTVRTRNNGELLTQVYELDTLENDLIQHYVRKWGVQGCQGRPDNDGFWQAWGVVYELAIQYRCEVQAQVIRRLFAVHDRDLNTRKAS
jgi:hypothetical protein